MQACFPPAPNPTPLSTSCGPTSRPVGHGSTGMRKAKAGQSPLCPVLSFVPLGAGEQHAHLQRIPSSIQKPRSHRRSVVQGVRCLRGSPVRNAGPAFLRLASAPIRHPGLGPCPPAPPFAPRFRARLQAGSRDKAAASILPLRAGPSSVRAVLARLRSARPGPSPPFLGPPPRGGLRVRHGLRPHRSVIRPFRRVAPPPSFPHPQLALVCREHLLAFIAPYPAKLDAPSRGRPDIGPSPTLKQMVQTQRKGHSGRTFHRGSANRYQSARSPSPRPAPERGPEQQAPVPRFVPRPVPPLRFRD